MKNKLYAPIIKTGDAELRALSNIVFDKSKLFPIIELTRGRKSKNDKVGILSKRLEKIRTIFAKSDICLDLTTSSSLSNEEIDSLYLANNGYENWIEFLKVLNNEKVFKSITPTILVNSEDANFNDNLKMQVSSILSHFNAVAYRNSLSDDACYNDLEIIKNTVNNCGKPFYFIVDCEYVASGAWRSFSDKAIVRISKVLSIIPTATFIVVATSFPNNVSEVGKEYTDSFRLNEIDLFESIKSNHKLVPLIYGDYASINPIRNDEIVMSRGWIPRIDVALENEIFYHKKRRGKDDYSVTYTAIAKLVVNDSKFPSFLSKNWGITQINNCSKHLSPGSTPSFWISVRMNIHLEQQMRRLNI